LAMGADAIAPQPAGVGQFERTRQPAVIGQQQQPLGVEVEPADRDQPRQSFRQIVEHGRPPFGIGMRGHQAARLVIHEQPRPLARRQHLAVDRDHVIGGDVERRRIDDAAVDGDSALRDPFLGIAARGKSSAGNYLGDALAGFLDARRLRGALVEFRLAFTVSSTAAERRTFCKNLAVVLVLATRPIVPRFTARMLLPVGAALRPVTGPIEFRAIFARTGKARTLIATAVVAGSVKARLVEIARTIARRAGAEGPIAPWTVAVLAKTFAARRIGPLLATAFSRGIGLLVAKFPIGETSRRTRIVAIPRVALAIPRVALAIPARGAVVA